MQEKPQGRGMTTSCVTLDESMFQPVKGVVPSTIQQEEPNDELNNYAEELSKKPDRLSYFEVAVPNDDDAMLKYANDLRIDQINRIVDSDDNTGAPDVKLGNLMRGLLKDLDSQIIGRQRVKAQEKTADGIGDIAMALDRYHAEHAQRSRYREDTPIQDTGRRGPANLSSVKIPDNEHLDGALTPVGTEIDINGIIAAGIAASKA